MTDEELEELVTLYKVCQPSQGLRYLMAFIKSRGLSVQGERARLCLRKHSKLRWALMDRKIQERCGKYESRGPNEVWHIDGHHKLILWGIVIHGVVDGYCRTVSYKRISLIGLFLIAHR